MQGADFEQQMDGRFQWAKRHHRAFGNEILVSNESYGENLGACFYE